MLRHTKSMVFPIDLGRIVRKRPQNNDIQLSLFRVLKDREKSSATWSKSLHDQQNELSEKHKRNLRQCHPYVTPFFTHKSPNIQIPSGKHTKNELDNHHAINGKINYKWSCSIAVCLPGRVYHQMDLTRRSLGFRVPMGSRTADRTSRGCAPCRTSGGRPGPWTRLVYGEA